MRRLYLTVYLAVLGVGVFCIVVAAAITWMLRDDRTTAPTHIQAVAELIAGQLPDDPAAAQAALAERATTLDLDVSVWDADGRLIARMGEALPAPEAGERTYRWIRRAGRRGVLLKLPDGRWIAGVSRDGRAWSGARHLLLFVLILGLVAVGCYPLARRITRRIEALQRGVEEWGSGDLGARVPVTGKDEVARLAESFNRAADRIQTLVTTQKRLLASASHELRSPLARVRMALELAREELPDARRVDAAIGDIEDLDALVGDLLTAARLEQGGLAADARETVNLLELATEEAARHGLSCHGEPVSVRADPRLLRRLLRNLLENARRHGGGEAAVSIRVEDGSAVVEVADRGPGVPEADRERIFEAFYRPAGHREGQGGVGLGLALVREIASAHGGSVSYAPRTGGGSSFTVRIPAGSPR